MRVHISVLSFFEKGDLILKRYAIFLIIAQIYVFVLADLVGAVTIWDTPKTTVQQHQLTYLYVRDEYQLRYAINGLPVGSYQVRANFWTNTGTYYDVIFDNPTKIAYLTCNGIYIFEMLDRDGNTIAETNQIKTSKIKSPACKSYENAGLKNELNVKVEDLELGNGEVKLTFDNSTNASRYVLYKNGDQMMVIEGIHISDSNYFYVIDDGMYTVAALDANGNLISSSDYIHSFTGDGSNGNGNNGGNNGGSDDDNKCSTIICECINELKSALSGKFDDLSTQLVSMNNVLDQIKGNLDDQLNDNKQIINELKDVNSELDNINNQLTPSTNPTFDNVDIPDLEDFGGNINVESKTDNTIYFEDFGQAAEPDLLPSIVEPSFNWSDGDLTVSPTNQILVDDPVDVSGPLDVLDALTPDTPLEPEDQEYELRWKSEQYP